jgi:PAS domain S-box-containing protein
MDKVQVLYIESSDLQRQEVKKALAERAFDVFDEPTGEKGLEALTTRRFNVVVCDLNMPGIGGMDVLRHVRTTHPDIPLIMVTAHPSVPLAVQAIQSGAYRFLTKPINIDELELTIHQSVEHSRMQRWLREADEQLRVLVETTPVPYIISRVEDGRILFANQPLADLVGLSPAELKRYNTTDFYYDPKDRETVVERLKRDGFLHDFELLIKDAEGKPVCTVLSVATMELAGEHVILGGLTNITRRKETEEALLKERNFVTAILDTAGALMLVADPGGRIVRFNRACEDITGYTAEEVKGKNFKDLFIAPEEIATIDQRLEFIRRGPWPVKGENQWITKSGERRLIDWANTALLDDEGKLEYIVATGIDITEGRKAEENLRLYREIFMNSIDVITVLDKHGRIIARNPAHETKSGYTDEEILGQRSSQFLGDKQLAQIYKALEEGGSYRGEVLGTTKQGAPVWIDLSIFPIRDEEGQVHRFIAMGRDISEIKMALADIAYANQELRETQSQLVQSEKMASLGSLVAGIAHEINTPVGAIGSMHDTLVRAVEKLKRHLDEKHPGELEDDPMLARAFTLIGNANEVIQNGCSRVTEIVRRLRSFARLDEAELKRVDLHEGLEDTLTLLHHEIKHHIKINRQYGEIPPISVYPGRLNQVFLNILNNARQAISGKGEITIKTWASKNKAHITISDTGNGIPEDQLKSIFDPGFTTKGVGVGTGLGLSICYQIIQEHKGLIEVESQEGKGTTFTIVLPMKLDELLSVS